MRTRRIAILIDGGFYLRRLKYIVPENFRDSPETIARTTAFYSKCLVQRILPKNQAKNWREHVYRFFFYDATPYAETGHNPISNLQIKFSQTEEYKFRHKLFEELRKRRNFALRLGKVEVEGDWSPVEASTTKKLIRIKKFLDLFPEGAMSIPTFTPDQQTEWEKCLQTWKELGADDIKPGFRQKGVDMRIGVDIATLTLKRHVDTIVLCTGDSDFVPAAKLARREGVEFLLDPLGQQIKDDLNEHIDGIVNGFPPLQAMNKTSLNDNEVEASND